MEKYKIFMKCIICGSESFRIKKIIKTIDIKEDLFNMAFSHDGFGININEFNFKCENNHINTFELFNKKISI